MSLDSEKLAIAAHLHVLLRRKTGRVTDTEWMAANADYAAEIVRFARHKAKDDGQPDLADWAAKLEAAMAQTEPVRPTLVRYLMPVATVAPQVRVLPVVESRPEAASSHRYVRGLR
jgi:hypothetical protein